MAASTISGAATAAAAALTGCPTARKAFVTGGSGYVGRNLITYLSLRGWEVSAIARSPVAAEVVKAHGAARVVSGELLDEQALRDASAGCEVVFHAAAHISPGVAEYEESYRVNVTGTQMLCKAAKAAGVRRLVHISTEAVFVGVPIHDLDETAVRPKPGPFSYPATKSLAEDVVSAANDATLQTVIMRPRLIWGNDDTTLMPEFIQATQSGALMWIGGGHYRTSTCHIFNLCRALELAVDRAPPGSVYFVTDGPPVDFREFVSDLLRTHDVTPPARTVPWLVARASTAALDLVWRVLRLRRRQTLSGLALRLMGEQVTVRDDRARAELGYANLVAPAEGLAQMRERRAALAGGATSAAVTRDALQRLLPRLPAS